MSMVEEEKKAEEVLVPPLPPTSPSFSYFPYYPPALPAPKKDSLALVIIVVIVVALGLTVAIPFMLFSSLPGWENTEWTDTAFNDEVALAPGGNFKVVAGWGTVSEVAIFMNATGGSEVDVYIMTPDQYDSVYVGESPLVFSALDWWEGVSELSESYNTSSQDYGFYVVVDNVDNPLRSDDAVPTGNVNIDLKVIVTHWDYLD
jgi:hypothetical protein